MWVKPSEVVCGSKVPANKKPLSQFGNMKSQRLWPSPGWGFRFDSHFVEMAMAQVNRGYLKTANFVEQRED